MNRREAARKILGITGFGGAVAVISRYMPKRKNSVFGHALENSDPKGYVGVTFENVYGEIDREWLSKNINQINGGNK